MGARPGSKVDVEMGVVSPDLESRTDRERLEGALDEQVGATVEPQRLKVDSRQP
jgi:hypothetical protein